MTMTRITKVSIPTALHRATVLFRNARLHCGRRRRREQQWIRLSERTSRNVEEELPVRSSEVRRLLIHRSDPVIAHSDIVAHFVMTMI